MLQCAQMQLVKIQIADQLLLLNLRQCGKVEGVELLDCVLEHLRTLQAKAKLPADMRALVEQVHKIARIDCS